MSNALPRTPRPSSPRGSPLGRDRSDRLPPFQRFLDTHSADVLRFLSASVRPDDVEDCFQETFIAALRAYPHLPANSNLRAWILTIAHRKAIDLYRRGARRATPVPDIVEVSDRARAGRTNSVASGPSAPPPSTDGVFPVIRDGILWEAVQRLPPRQRSAVLLRYLADLPHGEIAAAIGCSEDAARRSLHEGLVKLRKAVKP